MVSTKFQGAVMKRHADRVRLANRGMSLWPNAELS